MRKAYSYLMAREEQLPSRSADLSPGGDGDTLNFGCLRVGLTDTGGARSELSEGQGQGRRRAGGLGESALLLPCMIA